MTTSIAEGLRRNLVFFRRYGEWYRRGTEIHDLTLYSAPEILAALKRCGFKAKRLGAKGKFPVVPGMAWFLAEKPSVRQ